MSEKKGNLIQCQHKFCYDVVSVMTMMIVDFNTEVKMVEFCISRETFLRELKVQSKLQPNIKN